MRMKAVDTSGSSSRLLAAAASTSDRLAPWVLPVIFLLWGIATASSYYFIWLGGIVVGVSVLLRGLHHRDSWPLALRGLIASALIAVAVSAPVLWAYFQAAEQARVPPADIAWITSWGASLNTLPLTNVNHPLVPLKELSRSLYRGPYDESSTANFGVFATLLALAGLWHAAGDRQWWVVILITGIGLPLALGYSLRWNGTAATWPLAGVNAAIWSVSTPSRKAPSL